MSFFWVLIKGCVCCLLLPLGRARCWRRSKSVSTISSRLLALFGFVGFPTVTTAAFWRERERTVLEPTGFPLVTGAGALPACGFENRGEVQRVRLVRAAAPARSPVPFSATHSSDEGVLCTPTRRRIFGARRVDKRKRKAKWQTVGLIGFPEESESTPLLATINTWCILPDVVSFLSVGTIANF